VQGGREGGREGGGRCRRVRLTINLSFLRLREKERDIYPHRPGRERERGRAREIDIYPHMPGREREREIDGWISASLALASNRDPGIVEPHPARR